MASGGQVVPQRSDQTMDSKRDDDKFKLGVQGKGMTTCKVSDEDSLNSLNPSEVSSPYSTSRPTSSETDGPGEPFGSFKIPPEAVDLLENVITVNKNLEHQIEALRIRIDVEQKQHESEKKNIINEKQKILTTKEGEIEELKDSLVNRDERIKTLVNDKEEQDRQINDKLEEINGLRTLVKETEDYADKLSMKVDKLKEVKKHLESDTVYKHQQDEIRRLRFELTSVKDKLSSMETEIFRARNIIDQQSKKIKILEFEKGEMNMKFKEELEKASRGMRQEVERMREVMKQQYEEMRNLREQNKEISSDVRDIKDILLSSQMTHREPDVYPKSARESLTANLKTSNSKYKPPMRVSMPAMKVGQSMSNHGNSQLPPIPKDKDAGKWIPSGSRRTMNAFSAKGKRK